MHMHHTARGSFVGVTTTTLVLFFVIRYACLNIFLCFFRIFLLVGLQHTLCDHGFLALRVHVRTTATNVYYAFGDYRVYQLEAGAYA